MAFSTLTIETWGEYALPHVAVRIKRQVDRAFYDLEDKTFKAESECKTPFIPLVASSSPNNPTGLGIDIELDPKQFLDGDYTVYFHDPTQLYGMSEVTIFDGSAATRRCPSATEIAARVLDAHVASHSIPGSVGKWMQDVESILHGIQGKLTRE